MVSYSVPPLCTSRGVRGVRGRGRRGRNARSCSFWGASAQVGAPLRPLPSYLHPLLGVYSTVKTENFIFMGLNFSLAGVAKIH